jgi:hypothetical protein
MTNNITTLSSFSLPKQHEKGDNDEQHNYFLFAALG